MAMGSDQIQKIRGIEFENMAVDDVRNAKQKEEFVTKDAKDFVYIESVSTGEAEGKREEQTATPTLIDTTEEDEQAAPEEEWLQREQSKIFQNEGNNNKGDKVETAGTTLTGSSPSFSSPDTTELAPATANTFFDRFDFKQTMFFGLGSVAGMVLAAMIACYLHRRRRRCISKGLKPWTNEIDFDDEYSTDESYDSIEGGYGVNYPIDYDQDWLGGVGFETDGEATEKAFDDDGTLGGLYAGDDRSDTSSCSYDDEEDGNSLSDVVNNSQRTSSLGLGSPPASPPISSSSLYSPDISPPTVPELFQNTLSSLGKVDPLALGAMSDPLSVSGSSLSGSSVGSGSSFPELSKEQEELNRCLFLINDQILEQQRNLEAAKEEMSGKSPRQKLRDSREEPKKIVEMIILLENKKDEIESKLKAVRSKIKAHRMGRRKLFRP